jgi:hypothetical protein
MVIERAAKTGQALLRLVLFGYTSRRLMHDIPKRHLAPNPNLIGCIVAKHVYRKPHLPPQTEFWLA